MKAQDLYDFLQEPLSIEIDSMRDREHTQSVLIERESFTIEFDVIVITGDEGTFGGSGITSAELFYLRVENEDCNVTEIAHDLIYVKVVGAVRGLV